MKRKIFSVLLSLVAGVVFATQLSPTVIVSPSAMIVEPGISFDITAVYTNTARFFVVMEEGGIRGDFEFLIDESTKNLPSESMLIIRGTIDQANTLRTYTCIVESEDGLQRAESRCICITR